MQWQSSGETLQAEELARLLHARRAGKGKWMAKCPHHRERTGSLSITDMGDGNTRLHCFAGCAQADVLKAAGLTWKDLRPGPVTPEIRRRMCEEQRLAALERRLGLMDMLSVLDVDKRNYWRQAVENTEQELIHMRLRLGLKLPIRLRGERKKHGMDGAGTGTTSGDAEVREERLHRRPHSLPPGGSTQPGQDRSGGRQHVASGSYRQSGSANVDNV